MKTILTLIFAAALTASLPAETMLRHIVCFKFKADAASADVRKVEQGFEALKTKIPQIAGLEWGTDISPEKKAKGFTHCFIVSFRNEADRDAYLPHPEHKAFVQLLRPVLEDAFVIDIKSKE